jgi:hypothetical protein
MSVPGPHQRRLHLLCGRFGLDRQDRHDLALIIVGHEGSWRTLAEVDAERLCLVLVGYAYVNWLLADRMRIARAAITRPATPLPPVARRVSA